MIEEMQDWLVRGRLMRCTRDLHRRPEVRGASETQHLSAFGTSALERAQTGFQADLHRPERGGGSCWFGDSAEN